MPDVNGRIPSFAFLAFLVLIVTAPKAP